MDTFSELSLDHRISNSLSSQFPNLAPTSLWSVPWFSLPSSNNTLGWPFMRNRSRPPWLTTRILSSSWQANHIRPSYPLWAAFSSASLASVQVLSVSVRDEKSQFEPKTLSSSVRSRRLPFRSHPFISRKSSRQTLLGWHPSVKDDNGGGKASRLSAAPARASLQQRGRRLVARRYHTSATPLGPVPRRVLSGANQTRRPA